MTRAPRGVLFDFDGTLAPNLDLPDMRRQVIALTAAEEVPEDVYADRYIVEVITAAAAWLEVEGRDGRGYAASAHALITDIEMAEANKTNPFPGVIDLLADLRANGLRLGVVTRNCRAAVQMVFPQILDVVDDLRARDDVVHLKPDVRHLEACLETLAVRPRDAVMVGDGALDMHSGRALGMRCVGVLTGSSDQTRLHEAGADVVLSDVLGLSDALPL